MSCHDDVTQPETCSRMLRAKDLLLGCSLQALGLKALLIAKVLLASSTISATPRRCVSSRSPRKNHGDAQLSPPCAQQSSIIDKQSTDSAGTDSATHLCLDRLDNDSGHGQVPAAQQGLGLGEAPLRST